MTKEELDRYIERAIKAFEKNPVFLKRIIEDAKRIGASN